MKEHFIIGLMSGTSMDGLDIAACRFAGQGIECIAAELIPYDETLRKELEEAASYSAAPLADLDARLGTWMGREVRRFIEKFQLQEVDAVASHGQTILHRPSQAFTLQIGSGAHLAVAAGLPVICDFRQGDMALGGQGAPLVPIADRDLFGEYGYCLNLGGIANISVQKDSEEIRAWDICACNRILDGITREAGRAMDFGGEMALKGKANSEMLHRLMKEDRVSKVHPSLDAEEAAQRFFELASEYSMEMEDLMATGVHFIADNIARAVTDSGFDAFNDRILITGGGALNQALTSALKEKLPLQVHIPDKQMILFKEAIAFAYLGKLRLEKKDNILASVTGASRNHIGGALYLP